MPNLMTMTPEDIARQVETTAIAQQNDAFRKTCGRAPADVGFWVMTDGVCDRGSTFVGAAMDAVAAFETFTEDNDPHGERDFGAVVVDGERLFWKIDLYDADYHHGSPDRAALAVTRRVLTILLPSEY